MCLCVELTSLGSFIYSRSVLAHTRFPGLEAQTRTASSYLCGDGRPCAGGARPRTSIGADMIFGIGASKEPSHRAHLASFVKGLYAIRDGEEALGSGERGVGVHATCTPPSCGPHT